MKQRYLCNNVLYEIHLINLNLKVIWRKTNKNQIFSLQLFNVSTDNVGKLKMV